ncbi:hypothetical protein IN842_15630 [Mycobacteroides abscessus subsp. abscessus]|uniref:Uncharacterized protein n=1 Tax=Mycobacteroides immunogenum TaxID=83262 RepID=A0ABR5LXH1_9MYCO|nr:MULTISPECIES: hypothetical protein [Mycobacteroides]KPG29252.1 hypothetical protein AN913_11200 [Mycobacteroides immunogenum]KPG36776.1 hypothetical protein AN912_04100 [Mycobacteroides immunogenum]KPG62626.1 hypothetical protein AN918_01285 [Mycobacteroides immunogenum]QSM41745.1 hypothetical protein IN842_15630 [Mycobacteroides abscessus subsp. abscessus]
MTDTYTDTTEAAVDDPATVIAEGLRRLAELRTFHEQALADLDAGKETGRQRVAEVQAEVDNDTARLNDIVIDAANEFNEESARLIDTGWATPKVLADRGLGAIRVPKKK